MTIREQIEELEEKVTQVEEKCDKKLEELHEEIDELKSITCDRCEGYGAVRTFDDRFEDVCPACKGSGSDND